MKGAVRGELGGMGRGGETRREDGWGVREEGSCSGELGGRTGRVWVMKGAIWVTSTV